MSTNDKNGNIAMLMRARVPSLMHAQNIKTTANATFVCVSMLTLTGGTVYDRGNLVIDILLSLVSSWPCVSTD